MMLRLALAAALCLSGAARAASSKDVEGIWWTQDHDGVVQIYTCPSGLCGIVAGITGFRPDGSAPVDLHGHTRCHLQIIPDGKLRADGVWDSHITNPDNDKTYTITLQRTPDGRLRMRGYIGLPIFGETVFWTRFTGHLTPDCHVLG